MKSYGGYRLFLNSQPGIMQFQLFDWFIRSWLHNNYSMSPRWIRSNKRTNERVARVGYNHFICNKREWNSFRTFSNRVLPPIFISTILQSVRKKHTTSCHTSKRQSVVNLWRKPSSNYLTGEIPGKQTILEVFKCEKV